MVTAFQIVLFILNIVVSVLFLSYVVIRVIKMWKENDYEGGYKAGFEDGSAANDENIRVSYRNGWDDCEDYYKKKIIKLCSEQEKN